MTTSRRSGFTPHLPSEATVEHGHDRVEFLLDMATRWAHTAGSRLSITRQWLESEAIVHRPLTTLGIAFGLGVFTGWLVKRR